MSIKRKKKKVEESKSSLREALAWISADVKLFAEYSDKKDLANEISDLTKRALSFIQQAEDNKIEENKNKTETFQAHYIPYSDKMLLIKDSMVKLISRFNGKFDMDSITLQNGPSTASEEILFVTEKKEIEYILSVLDLTLATSTTSSVIKNFLTSFLESTKKGIASLCNI